MFELGNNLRDARHQRRIDLVIAEQDTKIRSKYLAALEDEEFDVLPGPVFVRGFLRTYSRYLGLDPQLFVDEYNERFGRFEELEEQSTPAFGGNGLAHEHATRGRRLMRTFVIVSLVVLAVLAWLGLRTNEAQQTPDASVPAPNVSTALPAQPSTPQSKAGASAKDRAATDGALDKAAAGAAKTK